jgi:hypothetical protein
LASQNRKADGLLQIYSSLVVSSSGNSVFAAFLRTQLEQFLNGFAAFVRATISLPKFCTPQRHHHDNNTTISLPIRPKQSPDVHSRARRGTDRFGGVARNGKSRFRRLRMPEDLMERFAFKPLTDRVKEKIAPQFSAHLWSRRKGKHENDSFRLWNHKHNTAPPAPAVKQAIILDSGLIVVRWSTR